MPKLIMMCGAPASGKSTYIKNHLEEDFQKWISRDEIRFALVKESEPYFSKETLVFNTFINNIINELNNDYDVYADATHLTRASRYKVLQRIPKNCYDEVILIWIKVDVSVAQAQNENRKGSRAYVEPKDLRRMFFNMTEPDLNEGFDEIHIIDALGNETIIGG